MRDVYKKLRLDDVELRDVGEDPALKAVGYELRPSDMRPSVWVYGPGESNRRHRQREQEELYYAIEGSGTLEVDGEAVPMEAGDFVLVPPESWRQITADEGLTVLVVGAPNTKDDAVHEDEGEDADVQAGPSAEANSDVNGT